MNILRFHLATLTLIKGNGEPSSGVPGSDKLHISGTGIVMQNNCQQQNATPVKY